MSARPGFLESEESLHAAAREAVGHDDFGDPSYLEGLRVLLDAYDREARLTDAGRFLVEQQIVGILKNRLIAQKFWRERPEILGIEIRRPIFILGLPRTGTTALHFLLGQNPANQVLEYWLAANPCPRPPRDEWEADPRFQQAAQELSAMYEMDPSLKAMHLMTAAGPEECRHLLCQSFTDDTFDCNATIPSYSAWYRRHDMRPTYERHRDLLKLIGSPTPEKRWLLKYPAHLGNLRTVFQVYPDACVVQTHRDPSRVMPSLCSLVAGWRAIYEHDVDRRDVADWLIDRWAGRLNEGLAVRREHDPAQFFDLHLREILADPVGAARRICAHFGIEIDETAERAMRSWIENNPPGKHGEHRYRAEDFGFSDDAIADRFASYMRDFGIAREGAQ